MILNRCLTHILIVRELIVRENVMFIANLNV